MIIGVPKEIKNNENRVALDPIGVGALVDGGHEVYVESGAGLGSNFTDEEYVNQGGQILPSAEEVWHQAEMIMKVKEPLEPEFSLMKEGQIIFTYLHLANEPAATQALLDSGATAVAYEAVEGPDGNLPLLEPMSEVAGRMATQIGVQYLQKTNGGKGLLISGVPGTKRGTVTIIGGGTVGENAAKMAVGLGAQVIILELDPQRRRQLEHIFGDRVQTLASNAATIADAVAQSDMVIGSVLVSGKKAPKLVTKEMLQTMEKGSVLVDPAIDQGGNFEGYDEPTSHDDPVLLENGLVYYGVPNMPGSVPNTATQALAGNTVDYAMQIANKGLIEAAKADPGLAKGVNIYKGRVTAKPVAEDLGYDYTPFKDLIES